MAAVEVVLADDEVNRIKEMAQKIGLDFGEIDVLRDVDDGKIYVVDVNNTPCGPPNHLSKADSARAVRLLADSFNTQFFARTNERLPRKDVR